MSIKKVLKIFDRFEDKVRAELSRYPILYAVVGAVGIVLFWRGVWGVADGLPFLSNPYVSLLVSVVVLLAIGLFASFFVGDSIIMSGLRGEKKLAEKTMEEIAAEGTALLELKEEVEKMGNELHEVRDLLKDKKSHTDETPR